MTNTRTANRRVARLMRPQSASGFTLVEIAIVVVIVSVLLTMGIAALTAQITNTAISVTKKKQSTIQDSLTTYLGLHGQLPCPDTDYANALAPAPDGIENRGATGTPLIPPVTTQPCTNNFGIVPYVTLGLPQEAARDGWDNYFSYYVSNIPANSNHDWTMTASFSPGDLGAFNVYSTTGATNFLANAAPASRTGAVVLIVSHGKNGNGAITAQGTPNTAPPVANDEYLNTLACKANLGTPIACTAIDFWKRDPTDNAAVAGGPFDDIVLYLAPNDLIAPLIKDGTLQGPVAATRQILSNMSDAIIQGAVANGGFLTTPAATNDAWGNPINPVQWGPSLASGLRVTTKCVPTDPAYTLISSGPDGVFNNGTGDDVILTVPVSTVIRMVTLGFLGGPSNNLCGT